MNRTRCACDDLPDSILGALTAVRASTGKHPMMVVISDAAGARHGLRPGLWMRSLIGEWFYLGKAYVTAEDLGFPG